MGQLLQAYCWLRIAAWSRLMAASLSAQACGKSKPRHVSGFVHWAEGYNKTVQWQCKQNGNARRTHTVLHS
jgi:hypothetical protein